MRYKGDNGCYWSYECNYARRKYGIPTSCPSFFSGAYIDEAVSEIFLSALTEANLRISIEAFDKIEEQEHQVDNPLPAPEKRMTPQPTVDLINELSKDHSDRMIVDVLNTKEIMSANGQPFTVRKIKYLRYTRRIESNCKELPSLKDNGPRADGSYSTRQLAGILDVDPHTIFNWRKKGIITGYQVKHNSPWWFKLSQEELDKLKEIAHNRIKQKR